ncbi:MAG: hypothetical protein AOA66_1051 [Candidatus Bathyarchaeota archaeon BA2]|nr:MAG: hypothetical protein AOA66_1051 [Candidatus Bathyarchaeota archaeon BA2]
MAPMLKKILLASSGAIMAVNPVVESSDMRTKKELKSMTIVKRKTKKAT